MDPKSRETNDENFKPGSLFDQCDGRAQTRRFAEAFHRNVKVPIKSDFSLLDVGCAPGDALSVWHRHYPHAQLFCCDFSPTTILRCKELYGHIAQFYCADFHEINGVYDVIYCPNVLENFRNCLEITEIILRRCRLLYVMVPYRELHNGRPLAPGNDYYHKTTFELSSFDALAATADYSVTAKVVRAPGAWSPTLTGEVRWLIGRHILGRPGFAPRQVVYTIARKS